MVVRVIFVLVKVMGLDVPDLSLRLWPEGVTTDAGRATTVESAGKGANEVFRGGPEALRTLGYGNWSAAAVEAGFAAKPDAAVFEAQPFSITVDAWFNLTGQRTQIVGSAARLDGKGSGPHS